MKKHGDLGGCDPPQPTASTYNTLLDLHNSHKIHVLSLLLLIIVSDLKLSNNAGSLECRLLRTFIFLTAADRILWGELSFDRVPTIWVLTTTFDNDYFKQPTLYYLEPFRNSQTKLMSRRFDRQVYFKHT